MSPVRRAVNPHPDTVRTRPYFKKLQDEGRCAYRSCGHAPVWRPGSAYCRRHVVERTRAGAIRNARKWQREHRPVILISDGERSYLAGDMLHPENKVGQTKNAERRMAELSKATGRTMQVLAWHPSREFEYHTLRRFGRRDPFYDGTGKTEWPDADIFTLLAWFESEGGHFTFDVDKMFDAAQRKAVYMPPTLQVEKFQVFYKLPADIGGLAA